MSRDDRTTPSDVVDPAQQEVLPLLYARNRARGSRLITEEQASRRLGIFADDLRRCVRIGWIAPADHVWSRERGWAFLPLYDEQNVDALTERPADWDAIRARKIWEGSPLDALVPSEGEPVRVRAGWVFVLAMIPVTVCLLAYMWMTMPDGPLTVILLLVLPLLVPALAALIAGKLPP